MKLYARFAALYGWCPKPPMGLSRGAVELGLVANMMQVQTLINLGFTESIAGAFSSTALAGMAERAGLPEREIIKIKVLSLKEETKGQQSWQSH